MSRPGRATTSRARRVASAVALAGSVLAGCATGPESGEFLPKAYDGALRVSPSPVTLAARVGCVASQELSIANTHPDLSVTVSNASLPDASLQLGLRLPIRLAPGAARAVPLHFMPREPGERAGVLAFDTDEGKAFPLEVPVAATARARTTEPADAAPEPLDLVLVLDVSTTMNELARLRASLQQVLPQLEAHGGLVRLGLTTFENDVLVHRGGAFLDREAFFAELDSQLLPDVWTPDPSSPRQLMNYDFAENVLDALGRSAAEFPFREGARRYLLLMTDDTFLEPPAVYSDGTPARRSYEDLSREVVERAVRVFSVHAPLRGAGLSSSHEGAPSLPSLTGGAWFAIAEVDRGALDLGALILDLVAGRGRDAAEPADPAEPVQAAPASPARGDS